MKKKILIIGNSANAYALAKNLSKNNEIYITPASDTLKEFATYVDIREDNVNELLDYVLENDIDMTIPVSQAAIEANIVSKFTEHKQHIFGPIAEAGNFAFNKANAKKLLYKLHIPTPKFGIFEKTNMAIDYLKNQKIPFILKTNDKNSAIVLTSTQQAKKIIESNTTILGNSKVVIEDYIYGTPFSFYSLTDGYKALPIGSAITYKHSLDGNGGQLTSGMGSLCPNYKLSIENEYFLMDNVIYPTIEYLESNGTPYLGVLGVNGIITDEGKLFILGWQSFFQDCDAAGLLQNIDEDLYSLFESCIIGSFSDEIDNIKLKEQYAVSIVLRSSDSETSVITGIDCLDEDTIISYYPSVTKNRYLEYEAHKDSVLSITTTASSITRASQKAYSEVQDIDFRGIYYRKDICNPLSLLNIS